MNFSKLNKIFVCSAAILACAQMGEAAAKSTRHRPKPHKHALPPPSKADTRAEYVNFTQWREVAAFVDEMVAKHSFNKVELDSILRKVQHVDAAIQLIKPTPQGQPKNWRAYRSRFVEPIRINAGANFWNEHADALARAENQFGVPAEIIVGIIGVETVYGRNTGNFRVLDVLTTLGFDYPDTPNRDARMAFFRGELENTLLYARESGIDPFSLMGSYAGAIGLPQFMPGSIRKFAIDFDDNGVIDLRNSPDDAIGSVANFLVQHGWHSREPIVFPVTVASAEDGTNRWESLIGQGLEPKFSPATLQVGGVTAATALPENMKFGLVDLQNGAEPTEYWLGTNNFFTITKYNRSYFYAMSVIDLGRAVNVARSNVNR